MDDRFLKNLARAFDDATRLARPVAGLGDPDARFAGSDASGAVTVHVDGDGRLRGITLDRRWRRQLPVDALDGVVLEAVEQASLTRLRQWSDAMADDAAGSAQPIGDVAAVAAQLTQTASTAVTGDRGPGALHEILSMLETIDASLDELSRHVHGQADSRYAGHSTNRRAVVTLDGTGALIGVQYDRRWLDQAASADIEEQTHAAFDAAYRLADARSVRTLIDSSGLGAITRLVSDPRGRHSGHPPRLAPTEQDRPQG
jgi:DNA-binding protein YbaB